MLLKNKWKENVCAVLLWARKAGRLSELELAARLNKSERTIRRVEQGDVEPNGELIDAWLEVCRVECNIRAVWSGRDLREVASESGLTTGLGWGPLPKSPRKRRSGKPLDNPYHPRHRKGPPGPPEE